MPDLSNFEINKYSLDRQFKQEIPPTSPRQGFEESFADSSLYEPYQLRPFNPAELYQQRGNYDLYDNMREDDQISATLTLKKIITLNSDWKIKTENEEIAEFITACLNEYLDDTFIKKMFEIMSALDYGFSFTEKIWDTIEHEGKTKIALTALKTRAPHSIEFIQDRKGNITQVLQKSTDDGDIPLTRDKYILYTYQKEFDNPYGQSEFNKGVYRAWWSKEALLKFWNVFLERHGSPLVVGKIPRDAGVQEKNRFKQMMRNMSAKSNFTLPTDFEIDFLETRSDPNSTGFESAIDKYNTMISRSMLIPDLMGLSGSETSGGSFALGQEQFDIFFTIIGYIRQDLERLITKEIIQPLIFWNFGNKESAEFKFEAIDADKEGQNLKLWLEAVKTGKIPTTNEQVNWFLRQVESPEVSDEDFQKIEDEKEEMKERFNANKNVDNDDKLDSEKTNEETDKPDKTDDKDEPKEPDKTELQHYTTAEYQGKNELRSPLKIEKRANIKGLIKTFDDLELKYKELLSKDFELVINGLFNDIVQQKIIQKKRIPTINKLKLRNMSKVNKTLNKMSVEIFGISKKLIKDNSKGKTFAINDADALTPEQVEKLFEETSFWITGVENEEILKKAKSVLLAGIADGSSIREIRTLLDESLEGISFSGARLEAIVRTNINRVFNESRKLQFKEIEDEIQGYFYSAILDGRTSEICTRLDSGRNKRIYKKSQLDSINPPNHFNCRSVVLPVFKDEQLNEVIEDTTLTDNDILGTIPNNVTKQPGGFLKVEKEK